MITNNLIHKNKYKDRYKDKGKYILPIVGLGKDIAPRRSSSSKSPSLPNYFLVMITAVHCQAMRILDYSELKLSRFLERNTFDDRRL